jgi:uncharacterized protein
MGHDSHVDPPAISGRFYRDGARSAPGHVTLDELRRYAVARTLFPPTTLGRALARLGFVQADPIRAPARAQDLTLRHRVRHYRAGDLERRYRSLPIEEDVLVNYGFVTRRVQALMHPRSRGVARKAAVRRKTDALLTYVHSHGVVHPREVDAHFAHGVVTNYWGGSSSATTHLLEDMHYRGLLRVVRRDAGIRLYAAQEHGAGPVDPGARDARLDALVDVVVRVYAPLPRATLAWLVNRLKYAVPQWRRQLKPALQRATRRLSHARIDAVDWFWPSDERLAQPSEPTVRLLAPFDPLVWDRRRFELLWGWTYRFEAYTPVAKRKLGYYALPMLWGDRVVGWANLTVANGTLVSKVDYVRGEPDDGAFKAELEAELRRMRHFLGMTS